MSRNVTVVRHAAADAPTSALLRRIDDNSTAPFAAWQAMGSPPYPTKSQIAALRRVGDARGGASFRQGRIAHVRGAVVRSRGGELPVKSPGTARTREPSRRAGCREVAASAVAPRRPHRNTERRRVAKIARRATTTSRCGAGLARRTCPTSRARRGQFCCRASSWRRGRRRPRRGPPERPVQRAGAREQQLLPPRQLADAADEACGCRRQRGQPAAGHGAALRRRSRSRTACACGSRGGWCSSRSTCRTTRWAEHGRWWRRARWRRSGGRRA